MERKIVEQCWREGTPLPAKIENAPDLRADLQLYWEAFLDLSTCRPLGFSGAGPIPWTAAQAWCGAHRLGQEEGFRLFAMLRRMDQEFLSWCGRKNGGQQGVRPVQPADGGHRGKGRRKL